MLPLQQNELLEILVALADNNDAEIAAAAKETLKSESPEDLLIAASAEDTPPSVLAYFATQPDSTLKIYEATILNANTSDDALAKLAAATPHGSLLELIAINQQRLVRAPQLIEAILANPARTGEAERRARETKKEFFEKERGARQIAEELRARGQTAAAEFFESAELTTASGEMNFDDAWLIAQHIEVTHSDIDDSCLTTKRLGECLLDTVGG